MKAYVIRGPGNARLEEVPVPNPGPGEVLIRVSATALNHEDLFAVHGMAGPGLRGIKYPAVTGCDVSGRIVATGSNVSDQANDGLVVVYPSLGCNQCVHCHRGEHTMCAQYGSWGEDTWGGLAEYTLAPADNLIAVPPSLDPSKAAAAPVAFTTAWRAIMSQGRLRAGETALITGIGGGVASAALQLSTLAGATVYVTSSQDWKIQRAVELGATAGVNYTKDDVVQWVHGRTSGEGVDLVLDGAGANTWRTSINCLAPGGRMCVYGATTGDHPDISIRELYQSHRRIIGTPMGGRTDFDSAWRLICAGQLDPVVDSTWPLSEVDAAMTTLASARQFGKIVIVP